MPIYEYECSSCCFRFERRQHFHDEPVAVCPQCQASARRVLHSVPIVFKGSGFYTTDHGRGTGGDRRSEGQETGAVQKPGAESQESQPGAKAEVKAEVKAEAKD